MENNEEKVREKKTPPEVVELEEDEEVEEEERQPGHRRLLYMENGQKTATPKKRLVNILLSSIIAIAFAGFLVYQLAPLKTDYLHQIDLLNGRIVELQEDLDSLETRLDLLEVKIP